MLGKLRSQLIFIIYTKLSRISQYTAKSQELGKIINMLSNDHNSLDGNAHILFDSAVAPLGLTGILIILVNRFGWPGILILVVIVIMMPFQACIGKINGVLLEKINKNKDQRMKTCS